MANNDGYRGRGGNDDYHRRHERPCRANEAPPAEPYPLDLHVHFPPCSLMDEFMRPPSPTFVTTMINLREDQVMASILL
jgi:hypothetical protein